MKVARTKREIRADEIEPGDMVELEKTSGGIPLHSSRTLVLDVREVGFFDDVEETREPRVWLHLDMAGMLGVAGLTPSSTLGTFLASDELVEAWR